MCACMHLIHISMRITRPAIRRHHHELQDGRLEEVVEEEAEVGDVCEQDLTRGTHAHTRCMHVHMRGMYISGACNPCLLGDRDVREAEDERPQEDHQHDSAPDL